MKVIDLNIYRSRKAMQLLEKRISELATVSRTGTVREMKTCFKEWLKINSR